MRAIGSAACFLACAAAFTSDAADSGAEELRGIRSFTINVESLDEHALKCAVSAQAIEASARNVLRQSKVALKPPGSANANSFLYYNVNVISLPSGQCLYSFSLDAQLIGTLKIGNRANLGAYTAWHKAGIRSTLNANVPAVLGYDIESLTKSFVAAWSEVNP